MTMAERMNEIALKRRVEYNNEKQAKIERYYLKAVSPKIRKAASKGKLYCEIRIKRSIPVSEIITILQDDKRAFEVNAVYRFGHKYVRVRW